MKQLSRSRESQKGAVLFTALVMMVLMTLLAVTMMGNTAIDEKMAQNSQTPKKQEYKSPKRGYPFSICIPG